MKKWVFLLVALLLLLSPLMGGCGAKKYKLTISVSPSGGGTTVPAAGIDKYKKDTVVTITATAATGYQFVNWTGDASGTTATATVTMTQDKSVGANFSKIQYTLTMAKVGNGTTNPTVGAHTYDAGTAVSITATADTGSHFVNWSGDATGTTATVSVTMSANKTVTANFALSTYTLTMAKVGNGTIDPAAGAITEQAAAVVDLTATADSGWQFVNWSGDVATVADVNDATTTVTMNGNYTITANFIQLFTLTIAKVGNGTTNPAVGSHDYASGTVVNITATPDTGWKFDNWSGDATGTNATVSVTMSANKTVTANFVARAQYTLTMAVDDAAHVTTTTPPVGTNTVYEGVNNISATAAAGWKFDHWSGDVSKVANVTAASTTIDMDADYSITANFVAIPAFVLTMAVDDVTHGTITDPAVSPSTHNEETVVNITATALVGWKFDHWSGNVGTVADVSDPTTTVTMNGDYTITANFVAQAYPGVGSQWVYTVTYGSEVTTWTVNVTAMEAVGSVNCYKTETTFSSPGPVRVAGTYTVTLTGADAWRSQDNLAQYKAVSRILLGTSPFTTTSTDTYTAGTPGFFTVGNGWSFTEVSTQPSTTSYTVAVVGQETVLGYDCYKVEYSVSGTVVRTEWWSPEVMGIVKQVDTGTFAQTETRELVSFAWAA